MRARLFILLFGLVCLQAGVFGAQPDVLIYGATPAGIAAALAAAADGEKVLLVEPSAHVGGMMSNGLSQGDYLTREGISGAYARHAARVVEAYRAEFGEKAETVCSRGTHAEPKVNQAVFERMLAEQPNVTVQTNWALEGAMASSESKNENEVGTMRALEVALFVDGKGERHSVPARYFIDATYEGDLMAAAGVPYRVGREGRDEYHEPLAPEEADAELQAYSFRFCMTTVPENRVALRKPKAYDRETYTELLPLLGDGRIQHVFGQRKDAIFRAPLPGMPHGKHDINDMIDGPVRITRPGANLAWPDGGGGVAIRNGVTTAIEQPPFSRLALATSRQRIYEDHLRWTVGLIYFLQHDEAVPERFRTEALEWGWCRDEFPENGHVPEQLYVREARRLVGQYIFTEHDTKAVPGDFRAPLQPDAVAIGEYGPLCLGTGHEGPEFGGRHTGTFASRGLPYQVPFGVMVPRQMENLLVTCAVSASHVGFCALRYEPIWMALGEAAGHAAHQAKAGATTFQKLPMAALQARLWKAEAATMYVSDVRPEEPLFAAAQWWGQAGGWQQAGFGNEESRGGQGEVQAMTVGEYRTAFPQHAVELKTGLQPEVRERWVALAKKLSVTVGGNEGEGETRGDWLRKAWEAAGSPGKR